MPPLQERLAAALAPRYVLERELASGGMGIVFLGHDPVLGRQVAIKVLPPERATAVAVERFQRESRLLARLAHPHIVPVLEARREGDLFWFVMPHLAGDTLAAHLAAKGSLGDSAVRSLGRELLDALAHSHRHGVIHRDIKPANIFLAGSHALLADFGVAHLAESASSGELTAAGESVGTPSYMAPEQQGGGEATARSDLYSLGATLFEAASGRRWQSVGGESASAWRGITPELTAVLRRALQLDPAARWPDAETFAAALAHRPVRGRMRGFAAVGAALLLAAGGWMMVEGTAPPAPNRERAQLAFESFDGGSGVLANELPRAVVFALERFPRLNLVPWERSRGAPGVARTLAERIVTGRIVREGGGEVELQISVRDPQDEAIEAFSFSGHGNDPVGWGAAIADSLVSRLYGDYLTEFRMLAGKNPSREAQRHFFAGQDFFQRDQWPEAAAEFREARRLDSSLVMATWNELIALKWERQPFEERLAELAQHPEVLPAPLGVLVRIQMEPNLGRRLSALDSLAKAYPRYAVVQQIRSNELFHRGPLVGRSLREGVDALADGAAHFAQLDQADSYAHTVWGYARLGDEGRAGAQLRARQRVEAPDDQWGALLSLAVASRFHPLRARFRRFLLGELAGRDAVEQMTRAVRLGLQLDDPQDQLTIGGLVAARAPVEEQRASGESAQATASLLLGRLRASRAALERAARLVSSDTGMLVQRAEWPLLLPLFGVQVPPQDRAAAREQLAALVGHPRWGPRVLWALLLDATERKDTAAVAAWERTLRTTAANGDALAGELLPLAAALRLGQAGAYAMAIDSSESIQVDRSTEVSIRRGPFVRSATYFLRGRWRLAGGDRAGAEREWVWHENNDLRGWPSGEPQEGELDAALSAVARLYRGENLIAMREVPRGCALLRRVEQLWTDADDGFALLGKRLAAARTGCR